MKQNVNLKGEGSIAWKGGRHQRPSGYVDIYAPDHPYKNKAGFVKEHRAVVENMLGTYLNQSLVVHHINGIKNDNRIENLQVLPKRNHRQIHSQSTSNPFYGRKHSPESIAKIKEARARQVCENHFSFGKHLSDEHKLKISLTKRRKALCQS